MSPTVGQTTKHPTLCYEVFVRSFYDSNGDGIGDLNGLTQKLDYIKSLGADCIWLMPVAESPSYHGYDVTNYYRVEPDYGTNEDFQRMTAEAHRRDIRVLVDLVLNHMSSEHSFFREALQGPDAPHRDWFRWSDSAGRNWHKSPARDEYYYGFFWSGMPDLNWQNPEVRNEAQRIAAFWLEEMGVDGFRLDAIRHLIEQGDQDTNVPETHAVLREFGAYVRSIAPNAFTIGEVWDNVAAMLPYYPDQLDAYFAFEVSDSILAAVRAGKTQGLLDPVLRLQNELSPGRYAPFLRNHDQTRTMTLLSGDVAAAKLAATLLLTLPGVPFIYYGEETGMTGDKPDERLRTPMHWARAPAAGFTGATPWQALQPDSFSANVAAQERDQGSLLSHYRRLGRLRRTSLALREGELLPLETACDAVIGYLRKAPNRVVLVLANLGRESTTCTRLSSPPRVLAPGRYNAFNLLGGRAGPPIVVQADGKIDGYLPVLSLRPREAYLFEFAIRPPIRR